MTAGQVRKAIGTAIGGVLVWGGLVVDSAPTGVTAHEWLALGAVAATVAAVFGLSNDPPAGG